MFFCVGGFTCKIMFDKKRSVLLRSSTSAVNNNCSALLDLKIGQMLRIAVIHKSTVNAVNLTVEGSQYSRQIAGRELGKNVSNLILQAKWLRLGENPVLVLASQHGIQIYDVEGIILLHWHALVNTAVGDSREINETFARGIASLGNDQVSVGTNSGQILVFTNPPGESSFQLTDTLAGHAVAIGDLSSSDETLASGDDSGLICIWKRTYDHISKIHTIQAYRSPCTSLAVWKDFVFAGFTSGHLQLFSITNGSILAEIAAHARAVTAVDIAPQTGLALSSSEDTFVRFWQLDSAGSKPCIAYKHSEQIPDSQISGACFLTSSGSGFCASVFDSDELQCFSV